MTRSAPFILGISGLLLLGVEVWATRVNSRVFQARSHLQRIAYWISVSVVGAMLAYASMFTSYALHPNLRVFGVPFLSVVWESDSGKWIDFTGPLTLPAFVGNGAVAFLLPQLIVAGATRMRRRSGPPPLVR